jgi:hypothetical protein
MKRVFLVIIAFALTGFSFAAPQPQSASDQFINAFEAGVRARYYQEQIRLMELQRKQFELELKRAEAEAQQQAQKKAAQQTGQLTQEQVAQIKQQTDIDLQIFSAKRPDWKKYEPRMVYFASRLMPQNISTQEYLDYLYILAKATEPQIAGK